MQTSLLGGPLDVFPADRHHWACWNCRRAISRCTFVFVFITIYISIYFVSSFTVIAHFVIYSQLLHNLSFTQSHCTSCHSLRVTSHFDNSLRVTAHFVYSLRVTAHFVSIHSQSLHIPYMIYQIDPLTFTSGYPPTLTLIYALISSLTLFLLVVSSTINFLQSVCVCECTFVCVCACVCVCVCVCDCACVWVGALCKLWCAFMCVCEQQSTFNCIGLLSLANFSVYVIF